MSNDNQPNGGTPPLRVKQEKPCRDYLWGLCTKGAKCLFQHLLDIETMKEVIKFCHNYQNRIGCDWPTCTYLHVSRDEETLFLTEDIIPRLLLERYAKISAVEAQKMLPGCPPPHSAAPLPPQQVLRAHPPPPPPLQAPQPPNAAPLASQRALQAQPPPPPPPQVPTATPVRMPSAAPVMMPSAAPVMMPAATPRFNTPAMLPGSQPLLPQVPYDASRPPPSIPIHKRPGGPLEAGQCGVPAEKAWKAEYPQAVEPVCDFCEACVARELRMEALIKEVETKELLVRYVKEAYLYDAAGILECRDISNRYYGRI